ncbi:MAG: type I-E CRISPR-associated protein Cse1/CasA, partial [Methanocella sp.]
MATFNLLTEPWIPVTDQSGDTKERSILDTLRDAHILTSVSDPSPLIQLGIYRLLIAFVMDALALKKASELKKFIALKQFDMDVIDVYANQWKNRFDLFDEKYPFMQYPENDEIDKITKIWPIQFLMQHLSPSFNNKFLSHDTDSAHAFSFEQCARGLVTIPPFTFYAGVGYVRGINNGPPLYVLIRGDNIFQTILYNSCVIDPIIKPIGNEPPAWRSDNVIEPEKLVNQFSLLEGLTWRARRIRLLPGDGGVCTYSGKNKESLVREMYYGGGFKASDNWADPQVAYKITSKGKMPLKPSESREPWRDIGPLALLHKDDYNTVNKESFEKPSIVTQYQKLVEIEAISDKKPLILEVYGLRKDALEVRLREWTIEQISLPWGVMIVKNSGKQVQDAIDCADVVARSIRYAIKRAYARKDQKSTDNLDSIVEKATYAYWSSIKPLFMDRYLRELSYQQAISPSDSDAQQILLGTWKGLTSKIGARCLDDNLDPMD